MYGNCLYQALYKFKTLLRASERSMDKMGLTCFTVALTDWDAIFVKFNEMSNQNSSVARARKN